MDINGPICIQHQELHLTKNADFEVVSMSFSHNTLDSDFGIAIGKPYNYSSFEYYILITNDGGKSWEKSLFAHNFKEPLPNITFKVFCYDSQNIIVAGSSRYLFKSTNVRNTFSFLSLDVPETQPSFYINKINDISNIYIAYPEDKKTTQNTQAVIYKVIETTLSTLPSPEFDINCMDMVKTYDKLIENLFNGGNKDLVYNPDTNLYNNLKID